MTAIVGDIARLDVDAVACPWQPNTDLERIARDRIHGAGGNLLVDAARRTAARMTSTVTSFLTPSFGLMARNVIHIISPHDTRPVAANTNHASFFTDGLKIAAQRHAGSIAFLAGRVSNERDGYIARRAVKDVAHWCATNSSPFAIFFCCDNKSSAEAYGRLIASLGDDPAN